MKTSNAGIALIKRWEGCKLQAYQDSVGIWTIGYGHTASATPNQKITQERAEQLLRADLATFEKGVSDACAKIQLAQHQFDALVSFAYNVGLGNLRRSTLLRKLLAGDAPGAADQFPLWNKAGGRVLKGLVNRRAAERAMFLGEASV